jgi:carbonic anhydrase
MAKLLSAARGSLATGLSRRTLLRATAAGAGVFAEFAGTSVIPRAARAQSDASEDANITPAVALAKLKAGNARYVAGNLTSFNVDLDEIRRHTQNKQRPFAAVLSCADSRVPVEIIFDQSIGRLFVARVAGNVTTPEIIASLEYGVEHLGTRAILVLGHGDCGAIKATIALAEIAGTQVSALYPHIEPAVEETGGQLEATIRANARLQARLLRAASPLLAARVADRSLAIASGYYSVITGEVAFAA